MVNIKFIFCMSTERLRLGRSTYITTSPRKYSDVECDRAKYSTVCRLGGTHQETQSVRGIDPKAACTTLPLLIYRFVIIL